MKIYLQNPEKTQIVVFENENQIGFSFISWVNLTEGEIVKYELEKAKARKLSVLQSFYSSDKPWECTLKNTTNSITKTKQWFCINLSPSMEFETDQKTIITITIPPDKYFTILNLLSAFGTKVFNVNKDLQNKINLSTKVADIDAINIEAEFAKINKIILVA